MLVSSDGAFKPPIWPFWAAVGRSGPVRSTGNTPWTVEGTVPARTTDRIDPTLDGDDRDGTPLVTGA